MNTSKTENIVSSLRQREINPQKPYRRDLRVLKTLICKSNFSYRKVWEKRSKKAILSERCHIFFNNYKDCYSGCGRGLKPRLSYRLPGTHGKIEDALVCQVTVDLDGKNGYRHSLFCLTKDNWFIRFDLYSGKILEKYFLSARHTFRSLQWETEGHTIVLKSIQKEVFRNIALALCLFDVCPFQPVALIEINKRIFGSKVTSATASQGLLITMHSSGQVNFYSLTYILQQKKVPDLNDETNDPDLHYVQLTEEPPVLFKLKCADHLIQIGGVPWHYLYSPPKRHGIFHLKHLDTNQQAAVLDFNTRCIEPHRAVFHPDESGRVIHIGCNLLSVNTIETASDGRTSLIENFTINCSKESKEGARSSFPKVTQSGRLVKNRIKPDSLMYTEKKHIEEVDYENELDLMVVSSIQHPDDGGQRLRITTGFYDNFTGQLLKETELASPWESFYEHNVSVDLDTIIQRIKSYSGTFLCIVYRLVRDGNEEDSIT